MHEGISSVRALLCGALGKAHGPKDLGRSIAEEILRRRSLAGTNRVERDGL